jgi:hypothetical protein
MLSASPRRNVNSKRRPKPLSHSDLVRYSEVHQKLVVELDEAVRELSALVREVSELLVSQEREKHYH